MSLIEKSEIFLFKYIIIGDSFVGKSKILLRYTNNTYNENFVITIGAEFGAKTIIIDEQEIRIQIWDTAGMENFKSITRSYYKNSICALIVYDISNKDSFKNVLNWIEDCKVFSPKNILLVLIGNKSDLNDKRQVSIEEGKKVADENNMIFFETSAKDNVNINEVFLKSAQKILENIKNKVYDDDENLINFRQNSKAKLINNESSFKSWYENYCCSS
jgi:small GTP-binding protein